MEDVAVQELVEQIQDGKKQNMALLRFRYIRKKNKLKIETNYSTYPYHVCIKMDWNAGVTKIFYKRWKGMNEKKWLENKWQSKSFNKYKKRYTIVDVFEMRFKNNTQRSGPAR